MHLKRNIGFRAGIAEFLLVLRLKSRSRADRASDISEHAAQIIAVTCKHWFNDFDGLAYVQKHGTPPARHCVPL